MVRSFFQQIRIRVRLSVSFHWIHAQRDQYSSSCGRKAAKLNILTPNAIFGVLLPGGFKDIPEGQAVAFCVMMPDYGRICLRHLRIHANTGSAAEFCS